jgi:dienelactone hydrolase
MKVMPLSPPDFRILAFALRRRVQRLFGQEPDYFAATPAGLALSPSARHFADYDTVPLALSFSKSQDTVAAWQTAARAKLAELAGYRRESQTPIVSHQSDAALPGGLSRRTIYLRARPGVDIPIHLIAPTRAAGRRPVMICLQGTNTGAHLSWGETRFPADVGKIAHGYNFAIQSVHRGYLAVAIEQIGFGERGERQIKPRSPAPCVDATMHALLLGRSLLGERCSDVSAVMDWLMAEQEALDIDAGQVHIMGHSAGGSVALFAAALDTRISAVLAGGCLGFIRATTGRRRDDQGQNVIPGILNWLEMADIVGLIAPRPFVTVAGESDHIWPAAGAAAVITEAKAIYSRLGAGDRLHCVSAPGGHEFRPEISWQAFLSTLTA